MLFRVGVAFIAASLFTGRASAQTYYVNGLTGQNQPGNGSSVQAPWKSITYALSQIPRPTASQSATLFVEGNQIYSQFTTGESFPLRPLYNLSIEGTTPGGIVPAIVASSGQVIVRFDPLETYQRNAVTFRNLAFDGGTNGVTMGSANPYKHAPRFWGCIFRNHSSSAVRVDAGTGSTNDPRFFQCTFQNTPRGIEMNATASGAILFPDIEENTFTNITHPTLGEAIYLVDSSNGGGAVGAQIRSNWFSNCTRGVRVVSRLQAAATNFRVYSCAFRDITYEGVWVDVQNSVDPAATIEDSSFVRCDTGIRYSGTLLPGPYVLDVQRCVLRDIVGTGVQVSLGGTASMSVNAQDTLFEKCDRGIAVGSTSSTLQMAVTLNRTRALRNRIGFDFSGLAFLAAGSAVQVTSSLACLNTIGVSMGIPASTQAVLRCLTVADNTVGIQNINSTQVTVDHTIFAGNSTHFTGTVSPSITYSCFQNTSWPGTGNLNFTDPQLIRPFYKIASTSPCIDKGNVATLLPATDYEGDPRKGLSKFGGSLVPDIGADEYLLFGSANKYGVRGFGTYNFFPQIGAAPASIVIGGSVTVTLTGAIQPFPNTPATGAALVLGGRDDCGSLPFELSAYGASGSLLWNELALVVGFVPVSSTGTGSMNVPIPNALALVGQTFGFQWHAFLAGVAPAGAVTSDGLRVTLGQ